jgi:hypothetical protein
MNQRIVPGFTAEASLTSAPTVYRGGFVTANRVASRDVVAPQGNCNILGCAGALAGCAVACGSGNVSACASCLGPAWSSCCGCVGLC